MLKTPVCVNHYIKLTTFDLVRTLYERFNGAGCKNEEEKRSLHSNRPWYQQY